ncbi:hypothetical protein DLM_1914 [Aquitalea magnusonii]|uniref:Uncharacterized protein n=1 Tax=Aquitalea magnusonii TaxID=332411 RepID=A0A3G9GCC9_9NEIS|nr:hypothetical protein DLM_1914 [Aquitalea magnusonii]
MSTMSSATQNKAGISLFFVMTWKYHFIRDGLSVHLHAR